MSFRQMLNDPRISYLTTNNSTELIRVASTTLTAGR